MKLRYQEFAPPEVLQPHLRCVWELQGPGGTTPQLIVPDGSMELVLNFADPFEQQDGRGRWWPQPLCLVVGEVRRPVRTRPSGRVELLGVRFHPGAAPVFLGTAAPRLVDRMSDQRVIRCAPMRSAVEAVLGAKPTERTARLTEGLLKALRQARPRRQQVAEPVAELMRREGCLEIEELAARSKLSRRTLERRFLQTVGCPPKALAQVLRFRRVLRSLEEERVDWADTAAECGYYDQAHLVRDFKRYTGLTPKKYLGSDHPLTDAFFQSW